MADPSLNIPVVVRAFGINASSIPAGYSPAYSQYILSQALDFTNVAGKANEAGQGAYDAQVKNDEQDVVLADHEVRIQQLRIDVDDHEIRITANTAAIAALDVRVTTAEGKILSLQTDVSSLKTRMTAAETSITTIQGDYVSKTATANQMVQPVSGSFLVGNVTSPTADKLQVLGSENVSVSYKVAGLQVVGARQTGWTAATGTAYRGAFDANQAWTIGILNVLQIQEIASSLTQARQRIKALEDTMRTHGQIN
ncbi:phage tail protein [Citrobacter pasteurii]